MTAATLPAFFTRRSGPMDLTPLMRTLVLVIGGGMSAICLIAIGRGLLGMTPELPHLRNAALVFHIATVVPCVPLGAYLLLAPKGTQTHKQLGKIWVLLMVTTATSSLFLYEGMKLTWIHIFVPVTYRAAWLIVSTARKGDIARHRKEILGLYFGALMIPGIAAFVIPNRLMNALLFW
jgi:uncharacterized membrane protein